MVLSQADSAITVAREGAYSIPRLFWKPESGPMQRRWKTETHLGLYLRLLLTEEELGAPNWSRRLWAATFLILLYLPLSTDLSSQLRIFCSEIYKIMQISLQQKKVNIPFTKCYPMSMVSRKPERTLKCLDFRQVTALLWAGFSHLWNGEEKNLCKIIHED